MRARSIVMLGLIAAAFAGGLACGSLSDALIEEECLSESDCAGGLGCYIPTPVSSGGGTTPQNGLGLGWCLEQPVCVPGAQPYCPCALSAGNQPTCTSQSSTSSRLAPTVVVCQNPDIPNDCWCVPPEACPAEFMP